MEDRDPRGRLTWGPHEFLYDELRNNVFDFQLTCETLLSALIMFDVNNHQVINVRGYITPVQMRPRLDIIKATLKHYAEAYGFECEEVTESNHDTLNIRLRILGKRMEDRSEIIVGGSGWARRYMEKVVTKDTPIREQIYGLLQVTMDVHESYGTVVIEVSRRDGNFAGRVVANLPSRQQILQGTKPVEEIRTLLDEDTLPDEIMQVEIPGIPRPI